MLWYALLDNNKTSIKFSHNKKKKQNQQLPIYKINKTIKINNTNLVTTFILPSSWNFIFLKNSCTSTYYIHLYSKVYFIKIPLTFGNNLLMFDIETRQISLQLLFVNNFTPVYLAALQNLISILLKPVFIKLKFKGKGYYIFKNYRNTITPQFGYSHRLYLYTFFLHVKFLTKTTLIVFGLNLQDLGFISKQLFQWRPLNIFTGRGVRFSKQVVYKKSGKVSSYR